MTKKIKVRVLAIVAVMLLIVGLKLVFDYQKEGASTGTKEEKTVKVGVLQYTSHPALDEIYQGILSSLAEAGYVEGENMEVDFQNAQGDQSKLNTMSQQLITGKTDVLVGIATPAAQALANNTTEIPLILGAVTDPIGAGLVTDLERPGGNITGLSPQTPIKDQVELIQKVLPEAKTFGILYSAAEDNSIFQVKAMTKAAEEAGYKVKEYPVSAITDISTIVQGLSSEVDFLYLPTDNMIASAMSIVADIGTKNNMPIIPSVDTMISQGGLAGVGLNQFELGKAIGRMTADVLSGKSEPATTPIESYTKGEIIVNLAQAERLGITLPADVVEEAIKVEESN